MYYHAICEVPGQGIHWWMNASLEYILNEIVIPFINKQVIPATNRGHLAILNLSSVSYIQVYKTSHTLDTEKARGFLNSEEYTKYICTDEIIQIALKNKASADSTSLLQKMLGNTKKQVFVIMKFNDTLLNSAYEGVIKPIAKKYRFKPLRIDEIQDSGKITEQILEEIGRSEIILADLSGEKPNCYYEAGFAHALGKEVIFTARKGTSIHFDLSVYRYIKWETEEELRQKLTERFRSLSKQRKSSS